MSNPAAYRDNIAAALNGRRPRTLDDKSATALFAGEGAATANKEAAALAKRMWEAGASRDDIWRETHDRHGQGWFYVPQAKRFSFETPGGPAELSGSISEMHGPQSVGTYFKDKPTDEAYPGIEHSKLNMADDGTDWWVARVNWPEKGRRFGPIDINQNTLDSLDPLTMLHERQHQISAYEGANRDELKRDQRVPWTERWMEREAENAAARHYYLTSEQRRRLPPWSTEDDAVAWGRTGWDATKVPKRFQQEQAGR